MSTSIDPVTPSEAGRSPPATWARRWSAAILMTAGDWAVFGRASHSVVLIGWVLFWPWVWEARNGRRLLLSERNARGRTWGACILLAAAAVVFAACALGLFGEASSLWMLRGPAALALTAAGVWVLRRT